MIVEPIEITINNSYNLEVWEKRIIEKCIFDNPSLRQDELAPLLGCSVRSLIRHLEKHKIDYKELRAASYMTEFKLQKTA